MTSATSFTTIVAAAILCAASPLLAQNVKGSDEPSAVFVPQAHPRPSMKPKAKGHGVGRKVIGAMGAPLGAKKISPLPSGATLISETYGDWTVNCGTNREKKLCTISQAQVNKGTGQRVFAIELRTSKDGSIEGTILMPFGLKLQAGVIIKLDNEEQKLSFSTCLAQGCFVTVALPSAAIDAMRKAKTFTVGALSVSDNRIITFNVSLNGFEAAIARANQFAS